MKRTFLPLFTLVVLAIGCSPEYKLNQTPDDVYYSPAKAIPEELVTQKQDDRYQQNLSYTEDRFLQMKVRNYYLWNSLDDYTYWNDSRYDFYSCYPRYYSFYSKTGCGCGSYYANPYFNYYGSMAYFNYRYGYNPYWYGYSPIYYVIGYKNANSIVTSNSGSYLSAYKNKVYNNSNYSSAVKGSSFQQSSNSNGIGTTIRRIFTPTNTGSNNNSISWDRPARTFTPSTNTTSGSASSAPSSSAGGRSGGYSSSGSTSSGGRTTRN